jgi:hypothetical protein
MTARGAASGPRADRISSRHVSSAEWRNVDRREPDQLKCHARLLVTKKLMSASWAIAAGPAVAKTIPQTASLTTNSYGKTWTDSMARHP